MTYPLATVACTVDAAGISTPALADIILSKVATYQAIGGSDVYLGPDSQDYQAIVAEAQAQYDTNMAQIAVYNNMSPAKAVGAGLQSNVKINGIRADVATNSTVVVTCIGQAGTDISQQVIQDQNGNLWTLPLSIVIPDSGTVDVTATCAVAGAITADAGTVNQRYTIVPGWQTVSNALKAIPGAPVESDGDLRLRQAGASALPAKSIITALRAGVAAVTGVSRSVVYENYDEVPDANGIPAHSISAVVEGGDVNDIANTIALYKGPGCGTYGTTSIIVVDSQGMPDRMKFFPLSLRGVYGAVSILPLTGYVSTTGIKLVQAMVDFINALDIGQDVYLAWLNAAGSLAGDPLEKTFVITSLQVGFSSGALGGTNLAIAFNEGASSAPVNFVLTVVS